MRARSSAFERGAPLEVAGASETGVCGDTDKSAALGVEGGSAFGPPLVVDTRWVGAAVAFLRPFTAVTGAGPILVDLDARDESDPEERDDAGAALLPSDDGVEGAADVPSVEVVALVFLALVFAFTVGRRKHGCGARGQYRQRCWGGGGGTYL